MKKEMNYKNQMNVLIDGIRKSYADWNGNPVEIPILGLWQSFTFLSYGLPIERVCFTHLNGDDRMR